MGKSYSALYSQVIQEINKRAGKEIITTDSRYSVQPAGEGGSIDARALAEIITTIASDLADLIGPRIISGLDVSAIAAARGGGGHRQAAGFSADESPEEVTTWLSSELERRLKTVSS